MIEVYGVTVVNAALALWTSWQASRAAECGRAARVSRDGAESFYQWSRQEADRATGRQR